MKQHITSYDLEKLSDSAKIKLMEWWKPEVGDWIFYDRWGCSFDIVTFVNYQDGKMVCTNDGSPLDTEWDMYKPGEEFIYDWGIQIPMPLLSIGQMIEFLTERYTWWSMNKPEINMVLPKDDGTYPETGWDISLAAGMREELSDALWSACVEVLNEK